MSIVCFKLLHRLVMRPLGAWCLRAPHWWAVLNYLFLVAVCEALHFFVFEIVFMSHRWLWTKAVLMEHWPDLNLNRPVMKLGFMLSDHRKYKINDFTRVPLEVKRLDREIHYVGTARRIGLANCDLDDERSLKKNRRGCFDCVMPTGMPVMLCAVTLVSHTCLSNTTMLVWSTWGSFTKETANFKEILNRKTVKAQIAPSVIPRNIMLTIEKRPEIQPEETRTPWVLRRDEQVIEIHFWSISLSYWNTLEESH